MRILALVGSPRKWSNTDILAETILESARGAGHEAAKVYLYDCEIGPCVDCRLCKGGDFVCAVEDGMTELYGRMEAADVLLFATPVYWWGPAGPMKLLIDRMRPYFANGRLRGKKALIAAPAKDGPGEADLLSEMFGRCFSCLGIEFAGKVLGTAFDRGEIRRDRDAIEQAKVLGADI